MKARLDPITVLVAHAEPFIAIGVVAALREQPGLEVEFCGSVSVLGSGDFAGHAPDILVTDYDSGMALLAARRGRSPSAEASEAKVMMLTHKAREQDVRMALESGAHGYVLLDCPVEEFTDGMRALKCGVRYLCPAAARRMADSLTREALTPRELDVLACLARGNCNKLIANELDLAVGTIKIHLKALMAKLAARSRTQVVTVALQRGLIPADAVGASAGSDSRRRADRADAGMAMPTPAPSRYYSSVFRPAAAPR
jgi:two-component system NarL family response regulator